MKQCITFVAFCICAITCEYLCRQKFTRPVLIGYHCITNAGVLSKFTEVRLYVCIHRCMSLNGCSTVNYNFGNSTCVLSEAPCKGLSRDETFATGHFVTAEPPRECIRWVSLTFFEPSKSVSSTYCTGQSIRCFLGRLIVDTNVLPAKYQTHSNEMWTVLDGEEIKTGEGEEVLHVHEDCDVNWVSFDATTDPLPPRAVQGGYLANGGSGLYVMRAVYQQYTIFGYYDPTLAIGYIPHYGVQEYSQMDLMIIFWPFIHKSYMCRFTATMFFVVGHSNFRGQFRSLGSQVPRDLSCMVFIGSQFYHIYLSAYLKCSSRIERELLVTKYLDYFTKCRWNILGFLEWCCLNKIGSILVIVP